MDVFSRMSRCGVVPVVTIENADDAVDTARAMVAGGIDVMEITFRTDAAAECIRRVSASVPEMLVGAGTVITLEQAKLAVECGAKFLVAPGFNPEVVDWCVENGIAVTPGCVTPTEIMNAVLHGLNVVKFFPSNYYGGLEAIKVLAGPYRGVKFIPTTGINQTTMVEYLESPLILAVGGSWVCPKDEISAHHYEKITSLCAAARRVVDEKRG